MLKIKYSFNSQTAEIHTEINKNIKIKMNAASISLQWFLWLLTTVSKGYLQINKMLKIKYSFNSHATEIQN